MEQTKQLQQDDGNSSWVCSNPVHGNTVWLYYVNTARAFQYIRPDKREVTSSHKYTCRQCNQSFIITQIHTEEKHKYYPGTWAWSEGYTVDYDF